VAEVMRRAPSAVAVVAVVIGLVSAPTTARAQQTPRGSNTTNGYVAQVQVEFTGEAAPGGGASLTVTVAPTCWWAPAATPDYQDAVKSLAWYKQVTGNVQTNGSVGEYGPIRIWEEAAKAEQDGTADTSWYRATCQDAKDLSRFDAGSTEEKDPTLVDEGTALTYYYRTFNANEAIPPPLVDPEQLALAAREVMVIPRPEVDRNPKLASAGQPTLVGLPTWFWVVEDEALGGADGQREITATLGNVSATVTAETHGLSLSSPAGGKDCDREKALVHYGGGVSENSACTVQFERASVGLPNGYPVSATTDWNATWVGTGRPNPTALEGLAREFTANVPVAEVQNIVIR
jgi:hypothetical protein